MTKNNIFFDNASTTAVNKEVLETYISYLNKYKGNPSSVHFLGQESFHELSKIRENIIKDFKLNNFDLIFTSGATEANNLALKGIAKRYSNRGNHIIVSNIEHPSILETAKQLENEGFLVTYLPVNNKGVVEIETLKAAITNDTILVSIMAVNNEIGSINPIEDIANLLKQYPKIYFHVDAVQGIGKETFNFNDVDLITYCGHKIHGLKSGGILLKKKQIELTPLLCGGGQENNLRSGTNDVAMAAALEKATSLILKDVTKRYNHVHEIYSYIRKELETMNNEFIINSPKEGTCYILNFSSINKKASVIVEALSNLGIYVSSISACHSKKEKGSAVVFAISGDEKRANNTIRLSFDESNTMDEAIIFINSLKEIVRGIK